MCKKVDFGAVLIL